MLSISKDTKISILGDGGWGTTLAIHLARKGFSVKIWGPFQEYLAEVEKTRENRKFLPGFHVPENIIFNADIDHCVESAEWVILAIPSKYLRNALKKIDQKNLHTKVWLSVTKGIEKDTHKLMSRVIEEELGRVPLVVLSGPTISREVVQGMPVAVVVASHAEDLRAKARRLFESEHFTVLESQDPVGVQLGGSLKNVIAIAAGIVDGLGYGCNTKSVLVARGIAEIARLGVAMGAHRSTFMGLSGLGDLATTCFSIHSRNHACGVEIGKGKSLGSVLKKTEMVIEGVETAKSAYALAKKHRIEMPIAQSVYGILFKKKSPRAAIEALMHKKLVNETD